MGKSLEKLHPSSLKLLSHHTYEMISRHLWAKVLAGFALGIAVGVLLSQDPTWIPTRLAQTLTEWLAFPGHLFLRLVQMIVIPLVVASVIRGVASSENIQQLKKLGLATGLFFLTTTVLAIFLGVIVAETIKPGQYVHPQETTSTHAELKVDSAPPEPEPRVQERILSILPQNPLVAMSESNMLQIVLFALIVGVALISMDPGQVRPVLDLLSSVQEICMTVVKWAMKIAPLAVFGLTADMVTSVGVNSLFGLGVYMGTVLIGLGLVMILYLALVYFFGRMSPVKFLKSILNVQILAFSTSSSAAVMPASIQAAEDELKLRPSIAQFIIPLGATINMAGTAIYQMIATLFLAQVYGVDLSTPQLILVGLTAVGASVGSPGAPGVGIVILAGLLQSVGIPLTGIGMIIAVDRLLDMSRTVINVTGDLCAATVLNQFMDKDTL